MKTNISGLCRCAAGFILALAPYFVQAEQQTTQTLKVHNDLRFIASNSLNTAISKVHLNKPNLYGLGMPKGLNKELLIINGQVYSSTFIDYRFQTEQSDISDFEDELHFLVYAHIPQWRSISIPASVSTFADLQAFVEAQLVVNGIDEARGSMFQFVGEVSELSWFVVGGMGSLSTTPLKSFLRQKVKGGMDRRTIHAVGAFTKDFSGRATSANNQMHMHFVSTDELPRFVAHIDNHLRIEPGAILKIPAL